MESNTEYQFPHQTPKPKGTLIQDRGPSCRSFQTLKKESTDHGLASRDQITDNAFLGHCVQDSSPLRLTSLGHPGMFSHFLVEPTRDED